MTTRDIGDLGAWLEGFLDDPRLLILAPPAPPLCKRPASAALRCW